jgi:hypothetical protein
MPLNTILHKCFKSPNPTVNVRWCDEQVATDTIQSNVPAIDGGEKYTQIFVGMKSLIRVGDILISGFCIENFIFIVIIVKS